MKKKLLFLFVFCLFIQVVTAQNILYSDQFYVQTGSSSIIEVPVSIKDTSDLYAFKLDVSYDSSIISFNRVEEGGFLSEDGQYDLLDDSDLGLMDTSTPGEVKNIIFSRKSVDNGASGSGLLFTLIFDKVSSGTTEITFSDVQLSDSDANEITQYDIYQLTIWDDPDQGNEKKINQDVTFYATLEDSEKNPVQSSCQITVDGNTNSMTYSSGQYTYSTQFSTSGVYEWSVTCESLIVADDVVLISNCIEGEQKSCGTTDVGQCEYGTQTCSNGEWSVCQGATNPATEVCDGLDNDCDSQIDEDLTPPPCSLQSGECSGSVKTCGGSQGWLACGADEYGSTYESTETSCDGLNNDCDSQTDEGCTCTDDSEQQCGTSDVGECQYGTQTCTNGEWGVCQGAINPATEVCDGLDNDCDGNTDEDLTPQACALQAGVCLGSVKTCSAGSWQSCSAAEYGPDYEADETLCDGLDNDCDGDVDEGCACIADTDRECGTTDNGVCQYGTQTCVGGEWATCEGAIEPVSEICDGLDNDCDGNTDEDLTPESCGLQVGVCAGSVKTCAGSEGWSTCSAEDYGSNYEADETLCDGLDNDCDGETDEGCDCTEGAERSCGTSDVGECSYGTQLCVDGSWGNCEGAVNPGTEVCDDKDNDCDGTVDENVCSSSGGSSGGGSSGGGSPGGSPPVYVCNEDWECDYWSDCEEGVQTRDCVDMNNCGTTTTKPETEQQCGIDYCSDGIQNNGEEGVDCGGPCDESCPEPEPPKKVEKLEIITEPEQLEESKITIKYDNTGNQRKSGVSFKFEIRDLTGNVVAEDFLGPVTIEEDEIYERSVSLPLYLLEEGQEYKLATLVSEKGRNLGFLEDSIVLEKAPTKAFITRSGGILIGFVVLIIIILVLVARYMKKVIE